jgi:hypothetical protein
VPRTAAPTPFRISALNGSNAGTSTPITPVRCERMLLAPRLDWYPSRSTTSSTRRIVSGATP